MFLQCDFDFSEEKAMIIRIEGQEDEKGYETVEVIMSPLSAGEFSVHLNSEDFRKLVVCGIRYFQNKEGFFYGKKFLVGFGPEQKEFISEKILREHPLL